MLLHCVPHCSVLGCLAVLWALQNTACSQALETSESPQWACWRTGCPGVAAHGVGPCFAFAGLQACHSMLAALPALSLCRTACSSDWQSGIQCLCLPGSAHAHSAGQLTAPAGAPLWDTMAGVHRHLASAAQAASHLHGGDSDLCSASRGSASDRRAVAGTPGACISMSMEGGQHRSPICCRSIHRRAGEVAKLPLLPPLQRKALHSGMRHALRGRPDPSL